MNIEDTLPNWMAGYFIRTPTKVINQKVNCSHGEEHGMSDVIDGLSTKIPQDGIGSIVIFPAVIHFKQLLNQCWYLFRYSLTLYPRSLREVRLTRRIWYFQHVSLSCFPGHCVKIIMWDFLGVGFLHELIWKWWVRCTPSQVSWVVLFSLSFEIIQNILSGTVFIWKWQWNWTFFFRSLTYFPNLSWYLTVKGICLYPCGTSFVWIELLSFKGLF